MPIRAAARRSALVRLVAGCLLPCFPAALCAQSAELMRAEQKFEAAKAANAVPEALKYGEQALKLTQAEGNDALNLVELLRSLGDFAAQAGQDARAEGYYLHALGLQETALGPDHPDLVRLLTVLADLAIKDRRYPQAEALLQRMLQIERAAYGPHHENVLATLSKLRELYRVTNDPQGIARVEAEMQPAAATQRGLGSPTGNLDTKTRHYPQKNGFATVRVFYGTNRAPSGELKPALFYGNARGDLQYGFLDVTIPRIHKAAELETQPRWAELTFEMNEAAMRSRYVLLEKISPLPRDDFLRALRLQVQDSTTKDVFIFVHGFNNTFEDAARRTAQLAYDLDFDGTPMMYSWPSQGSATAYAVDEAAVGISGRRMADFLDTVVGQSGAQRIHVIAHSMGNRALIEALQTYLGKRAPEQRQRLFGQIVLTAPDVDRDYFMDAIDSLRGAAERITLYASDNDYALRSSQFLHGAPRAGTAGDVIIRLAGLDTIDMSAVPADALGHNYFAANAGAIYDMFRLLWRDDPPPRRCGMSDRRTSGPITVWLFNANMCRGDEMLEAGVMLKRFGDLARERVIANIASLTDPSQKQEWQLILQRLDGLLAPVNSASGGASK